MASSIRRLLWGLLVVCACTRAKPVAPHPPELDLEAMRVRIERRLATANLGDAAVVIAIEIDGRPLLVTAGKAGAHDPKRPDLHTLFSIGSITKVFAGVLLADAVERGRVRLDQPVQQVIDDVKLPGPFTFEQLATHRSGLPMMPTNWVTVDQGEYTPAMFRSFLESYTLPWAPGAKVSYGNVGYAVLGDALARRESTTFRALLETRVLEPLGMHESSFVADEPPGLRWAEGIDETGVPVPRRRDQPRMPACCAMQSTASDVMQLVRATLHPKDDAIGRAIRTSLVSRGQGDGSFDDVEMALGWLLRLPDGVAVKEGSMKGFSTAIAVDRARDVGVVVLTARGDFAARALAYGVLRDVERTRVAADRSARVASPPSDATKLDVDFDGHVRLIGARVPETVKLGERVAVELYFRCVTTMDRDWRIFVHGDAAEARHRLHGDHHPPIGLDECVAGEVIRDRSSFVVPIDYEKPSFELFVGLHDGPTRMPIVPGHGDGKERVKVATIAVASL